MSIILAENLTFVGFPERKAKMQVFLVVLMVVCAVVVLITAVIRFGPSAMQRRLQVLRFDRWLRVREARSPKRFWIELIALAIALAVLIVLFDWWLAGKLHPATFESALTWGTALKASVSTDTLHRVSL